MKPGIKMIIAGSATFVFGAIVIPLLCILPLILGHRDDAQFKTPGSIYVVVKEPGRYYLWNDFRTIYNGKSYERSETIPDGLEIHIRDGNGRQLQFTSDASISLTSGSSTKKSIGYVEVEHPGKVTVQVLGGNEERIFSFSQSGLLKMFGLILGGVGFSMIIAIGGIGLIFWGIVKLLRAKRSGEANVAPNCGSAQRLGNTKQI